MITSRYATLHDIELILDEAEKGQAVIVTPPLVDYLREIQSAGAHELKAMGAPCPRDFVVDNFSVAARMIIDYGDLREKITCG